MPAKLRVGAVNYLNTKPLIERLTDFAPSIDLLARPAQPARRPPRRGRARRRPDPGRRVLPGGDYTFVPDIAIALARAGAERHALQPRAVAGDPLGRLDEGSRTSAALAQILLRKRYGVTPDVRPLPIDARAEDVTTDAVLLIGDRAMRACLPGFRYAYDLGQEWSDWTGLPFVYAVWAVRGGVDLGADRGRLPPGEGARPGREPARSPSARRRRWASTPASAAATSTRHPLRPRPARTGGPAEVPGTGRGTGPVPQFLASVAASARRVGLATSG